MAAADAELNAYRFAALEGALVVLVDGRVQSANPAAGTILGLAPEELVGASLHAIAARLASTAPAAAVPEPCPVATAFRSGLPVRDALVDITRTDGAARVLRVTCRPLVHHDRVVSVGCSFADVTVERPSHVGFVTADVVDLLTVDLSRLPQVPALPRVESPWARPLAS